jgi:DNA-binding GntR family transcriptional regulator
MTAYRAKAIFLKGTQMKIQQTPLGDQVYSIIWDQIAAHQLRPGDKISDLRLSEQLGVSRTPVREALHRLSQDGIVQSRNRRGFFVNSFSREDVREVYDIRSALEVLAVRLGLPNLTAAELEKAQHDLDQARLKVENGNAEAGELWLRADRDFHQLLARASQSRRLAALIAGLHAQIAVFQVYGTHSHEINLLTLDHHQSIVTALIERDSPAAERAMECHIQEVKRRILDELASREA